MCGIAGIWGSGTIQAMLDMISYRGPDNEGMYIDDTVQLGARCLRIMDCEAAPQPYYNEDKTVCVILNGEIYNYKELRAELLRHTFTSNTDTEVIAHAYEEFGLDCVRKFNGCFAFALWDGTRLVIGRDRLGQKPLYYYSQNGRFLFGSEIKSILTQIDEAVPNITENFRVFETTVGEETLFKDIYTLPRASILTYDGSQLSIQKYWELLRNQQTDMKPKPQAMYRNITVATGGCGTVAFAWGCSDWHVSEWWP